MFYFKDSYDQFPIADTAKAEWSTGTATWQLRKSPLGHVATVVTPPGRFAGSADPNCPVKGIPATFLDKCSGPPNDANWLNRARKRQADNI